MGEYIRHLTSLESDRALASEQFPETGAVFISHESKTPVEARQFLLETAQVSSASVDAVFDRESKWIYPPQEIPQTEDVLLFAHTVLQQTKPIYELAQQSLATANWFGYNDHGPNHIQHVTAYMIDLATQLQVPENNIKRLILEATGHDLGNLINRDNHSVVSPRILQRLYPKLVENIEEWRTTSTAIEQHNSGVFDLYIHPKKGQWKDLPSSQRIQKMADMFSYDSLLLLVADKIDVGRWRVNDKALTPLAIDAHQYSEFNLHFQHGSFVFDQKGGKAVWNVQFSPYLDNSELGRFQNLAIHDTTSPSWFRTYASDKTRSEASVKADFQRSVRQFTDKHSSAIYVTTAAALAMPEVDQVDIVISDNTQTHEDIIIQMNPDTIDAVIESLKSS